MNKEIKERWLAALRSGEYKQGQKGLRDSDNNFCCLGVLCDLHSKETGRGWKDDGYWFIYAGDYEVLTDVVMSWSGLDVPTGAVLDMGNDAPYSEITELNDSGYSFEELADLIEAQL